MPTYEKSIDVNVPVRTAYNQWTQFESFPAFMEGVEWVRQLDDRHTHWTTSIGGVEREFDAEITEQHPDERVAWRTTSGPKQAGVVTFHRISDQSTRVHLQLEFDPEGITENIGAATVVVGSTIEGDLARFKGFIESPGGETGAWRGDIPAAPQHTSGGLG